MPDYEICGVVQHELRQLPLIQQRIANGEVDSIGSGRGNLLIRKVLGEIVDWFLWCAHGFPRGLQASTNVSVEDLAIQCRRSGWPFFLATHMHGEEVAQFVYRQAPDLVIALGDPLLSQKLRDIASLGLIRVLTQDSSNDDALFHKGTELKVEYLANGSDNTCCLTSVILPDQTHDGPVGKTLKSDLIADDLLVQAAKSLGTGNPIQARKEIEGWVRRMLSPCLDQFGLPASEGISSPGRYRSILKLSVQSLLCFPPVVSLNWYRRLRRRYPVLILVHHLVSDRPHFMGIPTEDLWRRIRFLQRHYRIASLSEADTLLSSGSVSVPTVVLTFDDGYCDNYVSLRAVVEETGAKVTVFLATRQVEEHREFEHDLARGIKGFFPLTWDQVEDWNRGNVEFGSHTRTHFDCGSRDRISLETEIVGSGMDVEMKLHRPCNFFAFPFGKPKNMSPDSVRIAGTAYSIFLSSFGGENLPQKKSRQQHLLRKSFYSDPWELELEMQSVFDLVQRSRKALERLFGRLRPKLAGAKLMRQVPWLLLHAFLLLLAGLPPFRRLLNKASGDL